MALFNWDSPAITDTEFSELAELIYKIAGIYLGASKKELVKARLLKRIQYYNLRSFEEYYQYVLCDRSGDEIVQLLDAITTNVTSFFREKRHFDVFTGMVLPDILKRKMSTHARKIRIWSAGCSSGEEVYSLIMVLLEEMKDASLWDIKVLGTDISTTVLDKAKAGAYPVGITKDIPPLWLDKYFEIEGEKDQRHYKVKKRVRDMAMFARLNLVTSEFSFRSKLDAVFCRNVMIYFDRPGRQEVVGKIYRCLDEMGYLFVGHSESFLGIKVPFRTIAPSVYQRVGS